MRSACLLLLGVAILSSASASGQETPPSDGSRSGLKSAKAEAPEKPGPYGSNPSAGHILERGGVKLYYETYGEGGRPLVLLHGGLYGYIDEFAALIDSVKKDRRVIAIATRGHGVAELGDEPFSYSLFAEDAAHVIQHEAKEKVDVLGFSQGAITSLVLAASHPDLIHRLIVIGGTLTPAGATKPAMEEMMHQSGSDIAKTLPSGFVARRKGMMKSPERWGEFLERLAKLWATPVYVTPEQVRSITCPTLIVAGDKDPYTRGDHVMEIGRLLRKGQLALIPGCGHVVFACKPELTISITKTFLGEADR